MQQHSQIVELKDRLVQALDEHSNVKDLQEVKRIVAILEKTNVTLEDLERTRLGKYVNELRRKTSDKDLAKQAKKLIKSWREFSVGRGVNVHSSSTTPNATLTSPFNPSSVISPRSLSSDAFSGSYANSVTNGYSRNSVLSPNGNSHPALLRIKNQHGSLTSPLEKSKPASGHQLVSPSQSLNLSPSGKTSFRPHSQTASPRESASQVNGHLKPSSHQRSHSNLTSPVNAPINSLSGKNGLSPGLRNSFKNILGKDGTSPNNAVRRRTTPPMASSIIKPDSLPSSRHSSPLAFSFSNDSRDSASLQSHKSYSNQGQFSPPDTNDEDSNSNSSVFSSLSTDGTASYHSRSLLDSPSATKRNASSRKRKLDSETDTLRDNLNSIINSGSRRLQSTQELAQKFNINLTNSNVANKSYNSLSASSSPAIGRDVYDSSAKRTKLSRNGTYKNGFHHDENSLDAFDAASLRKTSNNKSLPSSPALLSLRNATHSATTSPAVLSHHSYEDDDDDELYSKASSISKLDKSSALPSPDDSASFDFVKAKRSITERTTCDVDREIMQIYQQLPQIHPIDIALMENFKFDTDDAVEEEKEVVTERLPVIKEEQMELDGDEDEYELFEYNEEYEEEVEEEVEVTDFEYDSEDEMSEVKSEQSDTEMKKLNDTQNDSCVHSKSEASDSDDDDNSRTTHREHTLGDISNCDNQFSVDTGSELHDNTGLKSQSTVVHSDDTRSAQQEFLPDSTNSCDDSNDAIPTSTSMIQSPPPEADSTTAEESITNESDMSVEGSDSVVAISSSLPENLTSAYTEADFYSDLELLSYMPSEVCLLEEFPSLAHYTSEPLSEQLKEPSPTQEAKSKEDSQSAATTDPPPTAPMAELKAETTSSMECEEQQPTPSPPEASDDDEDSDDDDDEDDDDEGEEERAEPSPKPEPELAQIENIPKAKRKRTKRVLMPVMKKKYRKCVARSRVKRSLVDRVAEQQWEFVNGTFDKDGDWHDFGEMTSAYVLRGGENASNQKDENVLHILPYANYSW